MDKDFYKKGETANIFFSWFPSADNFPNSRLGKASEIDEVFVKGKITNKMGLKCVDDIYEPLSQDHNTMKNDISLPVKRDCVDPNLSFALLDKDGNVLDERTFNIVTASEDAPKNTKMIILIIAILAVILLVIFVLKNKKIGGDNNNNVIASIAILVIFLFGLGFVAFKTNATEVMVINGGGGGGGGGGDTGGGTGTPPPGLNASFNLNQVIYDANSPITVTSSIYYNACQNATRNIIATGYINDSDTGYTGPTKTLFNSILSGGEVKVLESTTFTAPPTVADGEATLKVTINGYILSYKMLDPNVPVVESDEFNKFVEKIKMYMDATYSSHPAILNIYDILSTAENMIDLQRITTYINTISFQKDEPKLDFTRYYDVAIKLVGVTAYINNIRPSSNVSYDGSASIRWEAVNPVYGCRCSFSPANNPPVGTPSTTYCGQSNSDVDFYGPYKVTNLKANTEFTVECPTYRKW